VSLPPPGRLEAVCVAAPGVIDIPGRGPTASAIDKQPVAGRIAVRRLGLDGDVQVNRKHHGGEGQAVYAYAQEDADHWSAELGRDLPAGRFGENLRTTGVDLTAAVIGERWRVGTTLLEVTAPRTPCAKFQAYWGVPQLIKRFTAHGATGAYLRVLEPGEVGAGDAIEVVLRPDHRVTTGSAFRILTTQKHRIGELAPALQYLPDRARPKVTAALSDRSGASA
jgi:MOSC domain-containing protein YiiM